MNISFTGINNPTIKKENNSVLGLFMNNNGFVKNGKKDYTIYTLDATLNNDKYGNDLSDFYKAINKSELSYQMKCINFDNPEKIKFVVKSFVANDESGQCKKTMFKLNGKEIFIHARQNIPLFEYLAKLTKKISSAPNINEDIKSYAKEMNKGIHTTFIKFLERI